jgi:S-DNA-T family DNA segregation ATPase FtsK/SpoIIIE
VSDTRQASVSFIQRRLQIGYNRSARMVEQMERDGIVGPANGIKPREVLAPRGEYLAAAD